MNKFLKSFFILLALLFFTPSAHAGEDDINFEESSEVLCLPASYFEDLPTECLVVGSAKYQTENSEIDHNIDTLPQRFQSTDEELGVTAKKYIWLDSDASLKIYYSLDDAVSSPTSDGNFPGGFSYATFQYRQVVDGRSYFLLEDNTWIKGADVLREVSPTQFRGILTNGTTPERPFGWVLFSGETHILPGWNTPTTQHYLSRYELVEVYESVNISGFEWYRIGKDEWMEQRWLGLVFPNIEPPNGVKNGRWIELNLFEQTTAVYQNGQLIFATLTTSGSDKYFTRPGLFKIYEKVETTTMGGGVEADRSDRYYLQGVPWTMYFDERRAFHGEYWHDHLGYQSSHGCANLSFADADWLYNWAEIGDWVYVWDPSGETPVEEYLFTHLIDD